MDQFQFLNKISELQESINELADKEVTRLSTSDPSSLDRVISQTQEIKDGIRELKHDISQTNEHSRHIKTTQFDHLKKGFREELQNVYRLQREFDRRYRDQFTRQYQIINPNATENEVQQAAELGSGEGIFQKAILTSRKGQGQLVLDAVKSRYNELQLVERKLAELGQMFHEIAVIIERDEVAVQAIEAYAENAAEHIQQGNIQVDKGIEHVRRGRRLKWWCVLVVALIVVAVALGIGLSIGLSRASLEHQTNA